MTFVMPNIDALKEASNLQYVMQIIKESCNSSNKEIAAAAETQYKIGLQEYETIKKKTMIVSYIEVG